MKEELIKYYSYSVYKPVVSIEGQLIIINNPTQAIAQEKQAYDKVVAYAAIGK